MPAIKAYEQQVLNSGETIIAKAFPLKRQNPGTEELSDYWFDFIFTPVYNENNEIDGIAFFGFEVSDLMKAQYATKELCIKKMNL